MSFQEEQASKSANKWGIMDKIDSYKSLLNNNKITNAIIVNYPCTLGYAQKDKNEFIFSFIEPSVDWN